MTRKFTLEEKQKLVTKYFSGESVRSITKISGVPSSTLYSWIKLYRPDFESKENFLLTRKYNSSDEL